MELKWYEFTQNNSGGYFEADENVCHRMLIEASSFDEVIEKAESLGCYWNGVTPDTRIFYADGTAEEV